MSKLVKLKAKLAERESTQGSAEYLEEEIAAIEGRLEMLPEGIACINQQYDLRALEMADRLDVVRHRAEIEKLWRAHDSNVLEALNKNTGALLAVARAIEGKKL